LVYIPPLLLKLCTVSTLGVIGHIFPHMTCAFLSP
jgi:hypothetical protein